LIEKDGIYATLHRLQFQIPASPTAAP